MNRWSAGIRKSELEGIGPHPPVYLAMWKSVYCAGECYRCRSESETLDLKFLDWMKASLVIKMKILPVLSTSDFSNRTCSIRNVLWSPAQGTMDWYTFECKATLAAQVMLNRLSHYGGRFCVVSYELCEARLDLEMKHKKQQSKALCHSFKTHTHTHILIKPYNHEKVWMTLLCDFCPTFPFTHFILHPKCS